MAALIEQEFAALPLSRFPVTPRGRIAVIRSDMTIAEAVQYLHERNILSAPVLDVTKEDSDTWKDKYLGVLDMIKLCVHMLNSMEFRPKISEEDEDNENFAGALNLDPLPTEFANRKVKDLTKKEDGLFPFLPLDINSTLLDALILLGTFRAKRIPLIDGPKGDIVNIVSQSSMIHILSQHKASFKALSDKTLEDMGLATPGHVHSIRADQSVHAAFALIRSNGVSAVPVLGEDGAIIGNVSARHVYFVITARNKHRLLEMPAAHFLRFTSDIGMPIDIKNTAVICRPNETLGHVMDRMDAAHIHRIYLCDETNKPIRVISLCDVLSKFVVGVGAESGCSMQ